MKKYAALKETGPSRGSMKTELHIEKKTAPERQTRRWSAHREEKRESDVGVFVRSVLEMIRQQPGISRTELRDLYTKREQAFVDEALLRLRSDRRVVWKEDNRSVRLYLQRQISDS